MEASVAEILYILDLTSSSCGNLRGHKSVSYVLLLVLLLVVVGKAMYKLSNGVC